MPEAWLPALRDDDLWEGEMTAVLVGSEHVLLINVGGALRAYSNMCPHQAAPLVDGVLVGEKLTCARHLWEFNALTGLGINPSSARLRAFPCVTGDDGTVYVGLSR